MAKLTGGGLFTLLPLDRVESRFVSSSDDMLGGLNSLESAESLLVSSSDGSLGIVSEMPIHSLRDWECSLDLEGSLDRS